MSTAIDGRTIEIAVGTLSDCGVRFLPIAGICPKRIKHALLARSRNLEHRARVEFSAVRGRAVKITIRTLDYAGDRVVSVTRRKAERIKNRGCHAR